MTKTGLELITHISSLFNDIYNERLPKDIDNNESMLSLLNLTGQDIFIDNLHGIEVILFKNFSNYCFILSLLKVCA